MENCAPKDTQITLDPRRGERFAISVAGEFITSAGKKPCIVEDISPTGARITGNFDVVPGESGILKCRELDILTEVRWKASHDMGLSFAEPINEEGDLECLDDDDCFQEAQRRATNRRFLRMLWTLA